ncbi:type VII secretion-associated protein [soil metagenome]
MDRAAVRATAVCEIGPDSVRRLCCRTDKSVISAEPAMAAAVLDGGDDPLVLLAGRPVVADELWRAVLGPLLQGLDDTVLVHPSWWPTARVEAVRTIARELCRSATTRPRSWLIAPAGALVEIAPRLVVVTAGGSKPLMVQARSTRPGAVADAVAQAVLRHTDGMPVWLDGPAGVPGAHALAGLIGDRLRAAGRAVHRVDDHHLVRAAARVVNPEVAATDAAPRPGRRRLVAVPATIFTAVVAAVFWAVQHTDRTPPIPPTPLVEGRVTMEIPAGWVVQRITAGPGSARVQVVSPTDGETALHMTQSQVRDNDLVAAAEVLRRAFDGQPAGVFADFHPSDVRAGRPAITYREVRPGHEIRWTVLLDGTVRISIGCQSPADTERDIAAVCDQAVRSAHQID